MSKLKLNLGSGPNQLKGYVNIDRSLGTEAYPLTDYKDDTVDEIRASHLLEHFSHTAQLHVLKEWVRVLKPGGVLKIAVPDFSKICAWYSSDKTPEEVHNRLEGYLMGGHVDGNDMHLSMWDAGKLEAALKAVGLEDIRPWASRERDCACLPVSLNLQGSKPSSQAAAQPFTWPQMAIVESVPRLGFMDNNKCVFEAFLGLPVTLRQVCGAFWGSCLTKGFDQALAEGDPEFIFTVDYDTVFTRADVEALVRLMRKYPKADAICPLQSGRDRVTPLLTIRDGKGGFVSKMDAANFAADIVPVASGHFGLTIIRTKSLRATPKPWFKGIVRNGQSADDDIYFWRRWEKQKRRLYLAPHVVVGHLELTCSWPGKDFRTFSQSMVEYREKGKPEECWR